MRRRLRLQAASPPLAQSRYWHPLRARSCRRAFPCRRASGVTALRSVSDDGVVPAQDGPPGRPEPCASSNHRRASKRVLSRSLVIWQAHAEASPRLATFVFRHHGSPCVFRRSPLGIRFHIDVSISCLCIYMHIDGHAPRPVIGWCRWCRGDRRGRGAWRVRPRPPGLLRIRQGLTPLAAVGLVIIMIGATVVMWAGGMVAVALMNVIVALLAAFVAYGRWRLG